MASVNRRIGRRVARMSGVKAAVRVRDQRISARAGVNLCEHRAEGDSRIEITRGRTD